MRPDFQLKHLAKILSVAECRATQAWDPALRKVSLAFRVDPIRTMRAVFDTAAGMGPLSNQELETIRILQLNEDRPFPRIAA